MSTARGAKLKAQYNRVRTSTALRGNDMWTNTIGMDLDPQAGSNAAIEAAIYAPTHGGGGGRTQRRELAQQLIQKTGYQPSVTDYQGLLTLARAQGSLGVGTRGACKLCGGMGHLTKQCTNFLTGHNAVSGVDVIPGAAPGPGGAGPAAALGLLPDPEDFSDLSDLSSDSGSGSGSGSDSDSDRKKSSKKRKRSSKEKKSKEKSKKSKEKRKKHKKEKESKKSKKESKKRSRDSDSDSE